MQNLLPIQQQSLDHIVAVFLFVLPGQPSRRNSGGRVALLALARPGCTRQDAGRRAWVRRACHSQPVSAGACRTRESVQVLSAPLRPRFHVSGGLCEGELTVTRGNILGSIIATLGRLPAAGTGNVIVRSSSTGTPDNDPATSLLPTTPFRAAAPYQYACGACVVPVCLCALAAPPPLESQLAAALGRPVRGCVEATVPRCGDQLSVVRTSVVPAPAPAAIPTARVLRLPRGCCRYWHENSRLAVDSFEYLGMKDFAAFGFDLVPVEVRRTSGAAVAAKPPRPHFFAPCYFLRTMLKGHPPQVPGYDPKGSGAGERTPSPRRSMSPPLSPLR